MNQLDIRRIDQLTEMARNETSTKEFSRLLTLLAAEYIDTATEHVKTLAFDKEAFARSPTFWSKRVTDTAYRIAELNIWNFDIAYGNNPSQITAVICRKCNKRYDFIQHGWQVSHKFYHDEREQDGRSI